MYAPQFTVEDIFEVQREGETGRFDPWKANHNRQLLWHGSRLTNWVGILSQGLRIAPPEAPKTGYVGQSPFLLLLTAAVTVSERVFTLLIASPNLLPIAFLQGMEENS